MKIQAAAFVFFIALSGCVQIVGVDPGAAMVFDGTGLDAGTTADGGPAISSGSATAVGTVQGVALSPEAALAVDSSTEATPLGVAGDALILMTSFSGACGDLIGGVSSPSGVGLSINVFGTDVSGNAVAATPGTYNIATGTSFPAMSLVALATFSEDDASCASSLATQATGGTVMITAISLASGGQVTGTYNLNFGADAISGTFTAPFCVGTVPSSPSTCG